MAVRSTGTAATSFVLALSLGGCGAAPSSPGAAAPASADATSSADPASASLHALADLSVRRILLGDKVAAAKFGTPQPIDDPPRERQVLDAARAASPGLGLDSAESARFFGDQIEASKVVQRGLYADWTAHPETRPATRPDLGAEVRPQLDQITTEILGRLRDTQRLRQDGGACRARLPAVATEAGTSLDPLHRSALDTALRSLCGA